MNNLIEQLKLCKRYADREDVTGMKSALTLARSMLSELEVCKAPVTACLSG